jgi:hypothetical protein
MVLLLRMASCNDRWHFATDWLQFDFARPIRLHANDTSSAQSAHVTFLHQSAPKFLRQGCKNSPTVDKEA